MSNILGLLGIEENALSGAAANISGGLKILPTGFYQATIKKAGFYKNQFKSKTFYVEYEVNGETKTFSGSVTDDKNKPANHILAAIAEIAEAGNIDLTDEEIETSKCKVKDFGKDQSLTEFVDMADTEVGLICIVSYNADDDFQFREGITFCQADGTNIKGEDLNEKLTEKMEDMEEVDGFKVTKRRSRKRKSTSSSSSESTDTTKKSAAKI